ncbi:MAG: ribonuclease HI family protein [Candidatus Saccharimonadales bacterium]|jgi:ribonuclease HI/pterin-4a-carbinolamine dehydratase
MWQETNKGLYRKFNFPSFADALNFIQIIANSMPDIITHLRWQNKEGEVSIWLTSRKEDNAEIVTKYDHQFAVGIDNLFKPFNSPKDAPKLTRTVDEIKIFADGGSRGNPGPSASGYALLDMQDKIISQEGVYIGVTTNNQAEYHALKLALEASRDLHPKKVHVFMDSLLVVNQMLGKYKVRNRDLWPINQSINELAATFKEVTYTQIPRELNKLADSLVNQALDAELEKQ